MSQLDLRQNSKAKFTCYAFKVRIFLNVLLLITFFFPSESENSWNKTVSYSIYQSLRDLTSSKNQFWQCVVPIWVFKHVCVCYWPSVSGCFEILSVLPVISHIQLLAPLPSDTPPEPHAVPPLALPPDAAVWGQRGCPDFGSSVGSWGSLALEI